MVERYCHVADYEIHKAVSLASQHTAGTNAGTEESKDVLEAGNKSA